MENENRARRRQKSNETPKVPSLEQMAELEKKAASEFIELSVIISIGKMLSEDIHKNTRLISDDTLLKARTILLREEQLRKLYAETSVPESRVERILGIASNILKTYDAEISIDEENAFVTSMISKSTTPENIKKVELITQTFAYAIYPSEAVSIIDSEMQNRVDKEGYSSYEDIVPFGVPKLEELMHPDDLPIGGLNSEPFGPEYDKLIVTDFLDWINNRKPEDVD